MKESGKQLIVASGMGHVVIETDSLVSKQALQSDDFRLASMGGLIYELKMLIHTSFISVSCVHVALDLVIQ